MWSLRPKIPPSVSTFTFWSCNSRQWVHVRGLPALHNRFPHDLEVGVGFIVTGFSIMPTGLAVLSFWEDWLSSGLHSLFFLCVLIWSVCGGLFESPHRRGGKVSGGALYWDQNADRARARNEWINIPWQGSAMPKIVTTKDGSLS